QNAVCDPLTGCHITNVTGTCDDGNACTQGDECVNGQCLGAPTPAAQACVGGNVCVGVGSCDPGTGTCVTSAPANCDDGDSCTDDSCDPPTRCGNATIAGPAGALCEIDMILDQLNSSRPPTSHLGKLVTRRLMRRFTKLALRARSKVELASRASNPKAIKLLTGGDKKLQQLIQRANGAFQIDRVPHTLLPPLTPRPP